MHLAILITFRDSVTISEEELVHSWQKCGGSLVEGCVELVCSAALRSDGCCPRPLSGQYLAIVSPILVNNKARP